MCARTGTVLINRPTIDSAPTIVGRPAGDRGAEGDIVMAGQPHQQLCPGGLQHGVDGGVVRARQLAYGPHDVVGQPERLDASVP